MNLALSSFLLSKFSSVIIFFIFFLPLEHVAKESLFWFVAKHYVH